jgi:hypothetical protein
VSAGRVVVIAGREFAFGVAYHPREPGPQRPRRLVRYDPTSSWPGGSVEVEDVPSSTTRRRPPRRWLSGEAWARWAGEEVEPG